MNRKGRGWGGRGHQLRSDSDLPLLPPGLSGPSPLEAKGKREDVLCGGQALHRVTREWWRSGKGHHPLIQSWGRHLTWSVPSPASLQVRKLSL